MRQRGAFLAAGALVVLSALAAYSAVPAKKPKKDEPVFKLGGQTVVNAEQLAQELKYSPPSTLQQAQASDNAARGMAVEWYSRMLMSKAAEDDGLLKRDPGLAAAAQARAKALIAGQYLQDYIEREHQPSEQEVRQYYDMNESMCMTPVRLHIASIAVVSGKNASASEKQGAVERAALIDKRLAAGEEFGRVADELSDRQGRGPGGDLGWLSAEELGKFEGSGELLSLAAGKTKRVDQPDGEVLFFKVIERQDARRRRFDECKADVEKTMNAAFRQELALRLIDELAKRFDASINLDAFVDTVRSIEPDPRWMNSWSSKAP